MGKRRRPLGRRPTYLTLWWAQLELVTESLVLVLRAVSGLKWPKCVFKLGCLGVHDDAGRHGAVSRNEAACVCRCAAPSTVCGATRTRVVVMTVIASRSVCLSNHIEQMKHLIRYSR